MCSLTQSPCNYLFTTECVLEPRLAKVDVSLWLRKTKTALNVSEGRLSLSKSHSLDEAKARESQMRINVTTMDWSLIFSSEKKKANSIASVVRPGRPCNLGYGILSCVCCNWRCQRMFYHRICSCRVSSLCGRSCVTCTWCGLRNPWCKLNT